MIAWWKMLALAIPLMTGQVASASPQADATYIVRRSADPSWIDSVERILKNAFVDVYFNPISENGAQIADIEQFIALIPDHDIAPYMDRLLARKVELYIATYTEEQLGLLAELLRANEDATITELQDEQILRQFAVALEQARADAQPSGSDDLNVIVLEELITQMNAFLAVLADDNLGSIGQSMGVEVGTVFTALAYAREIIEIEKSPNNPITMAALRADGVLRFSNPVLRQTLIRQLSSTEERSGIQFIRPPTTNALSD